MEETDNRQVNEMKPSHFKILTSVSQEALMPGHSRPTFEFSIYSPILLNYHTFFFPLFSSTFNSLTLATPLWCFSSRASVKRRLSKGVLAFAPTHLYLQSWLHPLPFCLNCPWCSLVYQISSSFPFSGLPFQQQQSSPVLPFSTKV